MRRENDADTGPRDTKLSAEEMKKMQELLNQECDFRLSDPVMQMFLSMMDVMYVRRGESIFETGVVNRDIYVVMDGIFSYNYLSGSDDRCWGFALPGTMMYSSHSFYCGSPSFYEVEACCDSRVLHCRKSDFDRMIRESHEFAQWGFCMAHCQLYYFEMKNSVINGKASERFKSLVSARPEILEKVPMKTIASYLGITQQYLSNLKKKFLKNN